MKHGPRFQFPLAVVMIFTAMIATGLGILRLVLPYNGKLEADTPAFVPYVTIAMYVVFGGAIGFAIAAMRSKKLLRGTLIGSLVPIFYFAFMWILLRLT